MSYIPGPRKVSCVGLLFVMVKPLVVFYVIIGWLGFLMGELTLGEIGLWPWVIF